MPLVAGETKVCPVCDSVIDADARRCTECNTDLSLFDVDGDGIPDVGPAAKTNGKSIDDILDSIVSGKELRSDIFDDIKTIANNQAKAEDDILAEEGPAGVEFECPNCGTRVAASATKCPGCGAEFAEEAVEQFECPLCNSVVDVTATSCPNCGVAFAEEKEAAPAPAPAPKIPATVEDLDLELETPAAPPAAKPGAASPMERLWSLVEARRVPPDEKVLDKAGLYKELPRLVNDVKPLLLIAKKVGVEIGGEKDLITQAISYGKQRDVERAVSLIRQARFRLENAFTSQLAKQTEAVLVESERARATGADIGAITRLCGAAIDALEAHDYGAAGEKVKAAREEFDARSGGYAKARQELHAVRDLVGDARKIGLTLREVDAYVARADAAMNGKNYDQAAGYSVQARQALLKALPDMLQKQMKKARNSLLDIKVRGGDLTKSVGLLKQASIHMKREEYAEAVRFVRMFQDEIGRGGPLPAG
jgi:RNA polymerase subunit RPABC4/transcription elongation factor Spt4